MAYYLYNTAGTKLLRLLVCSDMGGHIFFRKYHLYYFAYNDKGLLQTAHNIILQEVILQKTVCRFQLRNMNITQRAY